MIPKGWTEVARGPVSKVSRIEPYVSFCKYCNFEVRLYSGKMTALDLLWDDPNYVEIKDDGRCSSRAFTFLGHKPTRPATCAMIRVEGRSFMELFWNCSKDSLIR